MYDVYRRMNNTHLRACWPVTVSDSELLLIDLGLPLIGRTELAWPITDLTC